MKAGDKVRLINTKGIEGYEIMKQLKKGATYTIERIKSTGGLILKEIEHPINYFGNVQGIMQDRFIVVKGGGKKKFNNGKGRTTIYTKR